MVGNSDCDQADADYSEKLREAKKLARSELSSDEWQKFRFHELNLSDELGPAEENCERIHCRDVTPEEFVRRFEVPCMPCVIEGLIDDWPAKNWTFEQFQERFGGARLKCGEDDDGNKVKLNLEHFLQYLQEQKDDAPMYVFDEFGDDTLLEEGETDLKPLLDDYTVPEYFQEDLMQYLGEETRPPFRWLLIGPHRSGSSVHIDPCGTSAWNSVIRGHKRWVLFPPSTPKAVLKPAHWLQRPDRQAIDWFLRELPAIRAALPPHQRPLELVTGPGATMFVPTNWWHAVLNLDDTIAVTQNFCSTTNFPAVYGGFRTARAKLSRAWLRALGRAGRDDLVAAADALAGGGRTEPLSRSQEAKRLKNGLAALHVNGRARSKSSAFAQWRAWLLEPRTDAVGAEGCGGGGGGGGGAEGVDGALAGAARGRAEAAAEAAAAGRAAAQARSRSAKASAAAAAAAAAAVCAAPADGARAAGQAEAGEGGGGEARRAALPSKWLRAR